MRPRIGFDGAVIRSRVTVVSRYAGHSGTLSPVNGYAVQGVLVCQCIVISVCAAWVNGYVAQGVLVCPDRYPASDMCMGTDMCHNGTGIGHYMCGRKKMMVLITYDVNTQDAGGRKRLRKIAKQCVNYGQRVQNSVFECVVDAAQCRQLQHMLLEIMDESRDSLRFYYLGNRYQNKVEHFGVKESYEAEGVLMI